MRVTGLPTAVTFKIVTTPVVELMEATVGALLSYVNGAGLFDAGGVNVNGASP